MTTNAKSEPVDVYLACLSDVFGWGGALADATGLAATLTAQEVRSLVLGVGADRVEPDPHGFTRRNVTLTAPRLLWRMQSWFRAGRLARKLHDLPRPREAFVAHSPFWALAAKRAWPDVRVLFCYPGLLSNCLPFTWPRDRPASLWQRIDFNGVTAAERIALRRVDRTLVPNESNRTEVLALGGSATAPVIRCDHGCRRFETSREARAVTRRKLGIRPDRFLLLTVGVCDLNKSFDLAIRVLRELPSHCVLVIVGDGPERANLAALAGELRVDGRVHFAGSQMDMAGYYAAADAVLSTSHYDANPNLVREALAGGLPAILPRHEPPQVFAGLAQTVRDVGCGAVFSRENLASLASAIGPFLDKQHAAEAGRRGTAYAAEHYQWDECARHVLGDGSDESEDNPQPAGTPDLTREAGVSASVAGRPRLPAATL